MSGRANKQIGLSSRVVVSLVLAVALLLLGAAGAQAASFTVNTTGDNAPSPSECSGVAGDCSLRQAIDKSNGTTTDDTITVPAGDYALTIIGADEDSDQTGDLDVNKPTGSMTITGAGARSTTIDATALGDRVLQVVAGTATISGFTITGGSPPTDEDGGGIRNDTTLTLTDSTVTDNATGGSGVGGGIASTGNATSITLSGDTFTSNHAHFGGGISFAGGTASTTNTTIAGNTADGNGGGGVDIDTESAVQFTNDTIASNTSRQGGGAWITTSANASFLNTIVANNTAVATAGTNNCRDGGSGTTLTDQGHNLDSDGSCFTAGSNGDITANPLLGVLQDNGGQTDTMALLAGSPAINAGSNSGCPATDQRGVSRPQGPACDIGAYEAEARAPIATTGAASSVTTTSATLNGMVNPENASTTYHFEYGTSTAYGQSTPPQSAGSDNIAHAESAAIAGLAPGTTYHFRIVATNSVGTSFGADQTFTTATAPLRLAVSPHSAHAGKRACFSFTATSAGKRVKGVTVRLGSHHAKTSSTGKARICATFRRGTYHAHGSKSGYRSASAAVRILAARRAATPPRFTG